MTGPWLVWSVEHNAWWGPDSCGYTLKLDAAGRYDFSEARNICRYANHRAGSKNQGISRPSEVMVPAPEWCAAIEAESDSKAGVLR
jgi:hypothetical protein